MHTARGHMCMSSADAHTSRLHTPQSHTLRASQSPTLPDMQDPQDKAKRIEEDHKRRQFERYFLVPLYKEFIQVLCQSVRYPETFDNEFDAEEFVKLRETYAISLTEACVVCDRCWVCVVWGEVGRVRSRKSPRKFAE